MTQFSVEVLGVQQVLANLAAIQGRTANVTTELLRDTGLVIQSEVDEIFAGAPATETGGTVSEGVTWAALTDAYLKYNPRRRGGQILRDTGELLSSLTVGGAGNILTANSGTLTFGTALPKGRGLQKKREFLFVTDSMTGVITARWEQFVITGQ